MTNDSILLTYHLSSENILTATAKTNINPVDPSANYNLELIMKNKDNQQIIARETYSGSLPISGQLVCDFFPYYAKNGCNFSFIANLTCSNPSTNRNQTIDRQAFGSQLDIIYYGYIHCFHPVWNYHYSCLVSPAGTENEVFDKVTLSLQPQKNCKLLEKPQIKLFYKDLQGQQQEYKGSFHISQNHTKYQAEESLIDIASKNGRGSFFWQCYVTYTKETNTSHKESAYIVLSCGDEEICI